MSGTVCGDAVIGRHLDCAMPRMDQQPNSKIEVMTVEGSRTLAECRQARVRSTRVFQLNISGRSISSRPERCGEILEAATAVIGSSPPFLSAAACARHLTFLEHLSRASYEDLDRGVHLTGPLRDDTVDRLGTVLSIWVDHFLYAREECIHPLAASWALDTAVVLTDLVFGTRLFTEDNELWEVGGLVRGPDESLRGWRSHRLESATMKREITVRIRRLPVLVRVPNSGRVVPLDRGGPTIIGPGELMIARIQRCHLSSGTADYSQFVCEDSEGPKHDLDERFQFRCGLFPARVQQSSSGACDVAVEPDESMIDGFDVAHGYMPLGEIPGDWIMAAMKESFGNPPGPLWPMPWKPM